MTPIDGAGAIYEIDRRVLGELTTEPTGERGVRTLVFVSAHQLKTIDVPEQRAWVATIEGIRIGVATIQGRVCSMLRIANPRADALRAAEEADPIDARAPVLVCEIESGERVVIDGGRVLETGRFEPNGVGVTYRGEAVEFFDVSAFYRSIETLVWTRSALASTPRARSSPPDSSEKGPANSE